MRLALVLSAVYLVCAWKHRFSSECLSIVHDKVFGARAPSYKTIQELDKMIKNFYLPPSLHIPGFSGSKAGNQLHSGVEVTMQRHIAFAIREISMVRRLCRDYRSHPLLQAYFICIADFLPKLWRRTRGIHWAASMRYLFWPPTIAHAPLLDRF